jgi:hypothetical protein
VHEDFPIVIDKVKPAPVGAATAACWRHVPGAAVVVLRWPRNLDVNFIMFEMLCSTFGKLL